MLVAEIAEQPRELALMRGQHHLRIVRGLDGLEQPVRRVGKTRQRVRIQHQMPFRRQRGVHEIAGALTDAGARSDHASVEPLVIDQLAKLDDSVDRAHHHRRQRRGIDRQRIARRGQRDEAGARPQRAAGRKPRRTGRGNVAGNDHGMAARVFVPVGPRHRKRRMPGARHILERLRPDLGQHTFIDADIGNADAAAMNSPRQQKMRRLAPEKRDGLGGTHRHAHYRTRGPVDAARQIDGQHRCAVGVDRLDHLMRLALHGPVEARAEQRIDDQRGLSDRLRVERQHRIFPAARGRRRIALQAVALAQQNDRDFAAARGEFGRRNKAVAAVIATARHHDDRPRLGEIHRGFRHRLARAQHQRKARRARRDREPIGVLHFGCAQNFHAESPIYSPVTQAYPFANDAQARKIAYEMTCLPIS